jgi:hypothetical protein
MQDRNLIFNLCYIKFVLQSVKVFVSTMDLDPRKYHVLLTQKLPQILRPNFSEKHSRCHEISW